MEEVQRLGTVGRARRYIRISWLSVQYAFDRLVDALGKDARIMRKESDLFLGVLLFLVGLFGFESGKYCDGNSADYLSCTRPSAYYYFDALDIICIVLGIFFILFWVMKYKEKNN